MTSDRHAAAFDLVRNLPGLEVRGAQVQLRGVGLLERTSRKYTLSSQGADLAEAYRGDPEGSRWVVMLADVLLGREPRTRAFVRLLSDPGASLVFAREGWFEGSYRQARIERAGLPDCFPLDASEQRLTLRELLNEQAWWCLGDWRATELLADTSAARFCSTRGGPFSLCDIGLALRAACEVLACAGLLREMDGVVRLVPDVANALLPRRASEFGWESTGVDNNDVVATLAQLLPSLRLPTGYVVASELRVALQNRGVPDPDAAIATAEREGRLMIYAEDYGQPRHGPGLFGDPRKQLVKVRIVGEGAQA